MEKHEPQLTRNQIELEMKAERGRETQLQLISFAHDFLDAHRFRCCHG
ncbi:hypothetical protein [Exiguobacterium sp.]|nr:hypothetical protein [Exiguobacterium sp.]